MRYKLVISYDGTTFHGFQRQTKLVSIQGTIEEALKLIFKKEVLIKGAGRTDALVHAVNQYAHFDTDIYIPPQSLKKVLNKRVSPYIYIKEVEITDETFHARLSAKKKDKTNKPIKMIDISSFILICFSNLNFFIFCKIFIYLFRI